MSAKQRKEIHELESRYSFNLREAQRMSEIGEVGLAAELRIEADVMRERLDLLVAA